MPIELKAGETKRLDAELTPLVQLGIIQGYVVNAETGEHIPSAAIYLDGQFALYSWTDDVGGYRIANIPYGTHIVTVEADNYQTTDFEIAVNQPIQSITLEMPPLPPGPPGEWSDGVEVQSVLVEPTVAYLGEIAYIDVYIQYGIHNPDKYPTPANIFGTVRINGQELYREFYIDYRNPTLRFEYMATQIGKFTAIAQDKSAEFTVVESPPVAKYYSPFGSVRIPQCTELIVPPAITLYAGVDMYGIESPGFGNLFRTLDAEAAGNLLEASPSVWNPPGATISEWSILVPTLYPYSLPGTPLGKFAFIAPIAYNCPSYWNSKEELALVVANSYPNILLAFFTYFSDLKGWLIQCGFSINELVVGFKGGQIGWGSDSAGGSYVITLKCPYCDRIFRGTRTIRQSEDRFSLARQVLEHIEDEHPDHPLTEPA